MVLTQKESTLLKDLKDQEMLCIEKYERYSAQASSGELKNLFTDMAQTERAHYRTITKMMDGTESEAPSSISGNNANAQAVNYDSTQQKNNDKFMCQDMLATEKHASALYNTCVFEFTTPEARKMLNHIQSEEQQHGEQLATFMKNNNMYN